MSNNKYGFGSKKADELQRRLDEKNKNGTVGGSVGISNGGISSSGSASSAKQPTAPSVEQKQDTNSMAPSVKQTANERLSVLRKGYSSPANDTLDMLYDRVVNQKPFDYDVMGDPTYNQYAETFRRNAALMSEDAMAQAAALTGGYGSSYGQAVGTQAYNEQMSRLNDIVPELRESAYGKYKDERARALEDLSLLLNERDYERSIFESDRAFEEDQRRFDIGTDLDKEKLEFQKYQYDNEIKREDALRAEERNAAALEMGFKSWDDYVKAVESGTLGTGNGVLEDFDKDFVDGAVNAYETKGEDGLLNYFDMYGGKYTEDQLSWLGDSVISDSERPLGVTYPENVPVMNSISEVETYIYNMLKEQGTEKLTRADKKFLKTLVPYEEMKSDGTDDANDTPEAYRRYLTWKLSEYLQDREYN